MSSHEHRGTNVADEISVNPLLAREGEETIPCWRMPDREMLPDSAYQVIHDELMLTARAAIGTCTICRPSCESVDGRFRPTPCPPTSRT